MKRILYVIGSLDVGGAERHLVQVLPILKKQGWDLDVFCTSFSGQQAALLMQQGVGVTAPPWDRLGKTGRWGRFFRLPVVALSFFVHLIRRKPHIVHFFLPESYLLGGFCALLVGGHVRVMSRRSLNDYQKGRPLLSWLERVLHRTTHFALGNSLAVVKQLSEEGFPVERVGLIYNGIVLEDTQAKRDRAEVREALGIEPSALVFIMVANLIPYKGHRDALEAFARARPGLPKSWVILMAGRDDGIESSLREKASGLGLTDHVKWLGTRRDVPDLLAASDVGLLCSHQEGFSNAILEAMGAGLPVVATDVGGNAEAVVNGVTGFIVPARSPAQLAEALVACTDQDRRQAMGLAARHRVESEFSLSHCVDQYENCYQQLGQTRRSRAPQNPEESLV